MQIPDRDYTDRYRIIFLLLFHLTTCFFLDDEILTYFGGEGDLSSSTGNPKGVDISNIFIQIIQIILSIPELFWNDARENRFFPFLVDSV